MKNYFLLYHDEVKQGREGVSFYYSDVKNKLYLRYARFQKGDVSTLASSKHSKEKLKKLGLLFPEMPEARLEEFLFDNHGNVGQAAKTICLLTEKDIKRVDDKRNQISVTGGGYSTSNHSSRSRSKSTSRQESPARTYIFELA